MTSKSGLRDRSRSVGGLDDRGERQLLVRVGAQGRLARAPSSSGRRVTVESSRSGSVLTKNPIRPSISGRPRLATTVPTTSRPGR